MYLSTIVLLTGFVTVYSVGDEVCLRTPCKCCSTGECFVTDNNQSLCNGCIDGYTGSHCYIPCPENCINCSQTFYESDRTCYKCTKGFYNGKEQDVEAFRNRNDCSLSCFQGCESCISYYNCLQCKTGYYMSFDNECKKCPRYCENCSSATHCLKCEDGLFWNNKICQQCKQTCTLCSSYQDCNKCDDGFYLKGSDCIRCRTGCSLCNSTSECFYCHKGYFLSNRQCSKCTTNCTECSLDVNSRFTCKACHYGYYLSNDTCQKCKHGCAACKSDEICERCEHDYIMQNETCYACERTCISCSLDNYCTACQIGYYMENGQCYPCRESCTSCMSNTTCLSCTRGFYGNNCSLSCPDNCYDNVCDNTSGICTTCNIGSYLNGRNDCVNCPENCKACQSHSSCLVCNDGYKGVKCENKCDNCKESTKCAKATGFCFADCYDGLSGDECDLKCDSKCFTCERNNMHKCKSCANNTFGKMCLFKCSNTCLSDACDDDDGRCTYGCLNGHWGRRCENNCSERCRENICDRTNGTCTQGCVGNYTQSGIACVCPKRCSCNNEGQCEICIEGYGEICEKNCSENCMGMSCHRNTGMCLAGCLEGYSGSYCTKLINPSNPGDKHSTVLTISGFVMGLIIVIAAVVFIIIIIMRKRLQNPMRTACCSEDTHATSVPDQELQSMETIDRHTSEKRNAVNEREIEINALPEYVAKMELEDFVEEFQKLPSGLLKSYQESQKEDNISKNRHVGIYPYDEYRVILEGGTSDYINASFIDGYKKCRAYIASAGPTVKHMDDFSSFWRMVWQEKCGKIVMLTSFGDNQDNKCEQYWPEQEYSALYGDINITCQNEVQFANHTVKTLELQLKTEKRRVYHFHFTAWPENGVPEEVTSLVEFRKDINTIRTELDGPILVHCSDGVSLTGIYIALDILTTAGEASGRVNIFNCVTNLREQRTKMVQTAKQYEYLHKALVRSLTVYSELAYTSQYQPDNNIYEECYNVSSTYITPV